MRSDRAIRILAVGMLCICSCGLWDGGPSVPWVTVHVYSDVYAVGGSCVVFWTTNGGLTDVRLELSRDNGNTWETISASVPGWTSIPTTSYDYIVMADYAWPVTDGGLALPLSECVIRLTDAADGVPVGLSEPFTIRSMQILHVDASASAGGDGLSWGTAFQHPQDAMAVPPAPGDEVWVAAGTYNEDEMSVVNMSPGIRMYGGFAGTEASLGDRVWRDNPTVLDARDTANTSVIIVGASPGTVVDGFTITGGNNASSEADGGGIYAYSGGNKGDLAVRNCIITANSVGGSGGGLWVDVDDLWLEDCVISANTAGVDGGGLYCRLGTSATVVGCVLAGNSTTVRGGGMCSGGGTVELQNCTFTGNTATAAAAVMVNTTDFLASSCIFWGDGAGEIPPWLPAGSVTYSNIQGGFSGTGNINADPLFVDPDGADNVLGTLDDDFRLLAASPCIDTADPATTLTEDIEGSSRPAGSGYDMGAYEYQP